MWIAAEPVAQAFSTRVAGLKRKPGSAWNTSEAGNSCLTKPPFIVPRNTSSISAAATPASASAPCATSTISDSTSRPSWRPNWLCAQPTIHPLISCSFRCRWPGYYPDMVPETITITRPDDWHVHLRDGDMLRTVAPLTARQFGRAIVMPNLVPPVTTTAAALAYRDRILAAVPDGSDFTPLMTCYLTDAADAGDRKSTRLNSSHVAISYAVFCLKKK